ncbi:hypothetical protein CDAR_272911 [Caerostris darwini]|uniref:Uncharacterized protein n=1 Tax=Caerostris darwini TaxID=1538125 RepID=A0AAV4MFD9_9ARAC|nr:hypothetical protein CDAR_272911 [Caerostris darwini]
MEKSGIRQMLVTSDRQQKKCYRLPAIMLELHQGDVSVQRLSLTFGIGKFNKVALASAFSDAVNAASDSSFH